MTEIRFGDPFLRRIVYALGVMAVATFGIYTLGQFRPVIEVVFNVLSPFIVAFLFAYLFAPVVSALQRRLKLGRIFGTLCLYMIILAALTAVLFLLIPGILSELSRLNQAIREEIPRLLKRFSEHALFQSDAQWWDIVRQTVTEWQIDFEGIIQKALPGMKSVAAGSVSAVGKATRGIYSGIEWIFGFLGSLSLILIIHFYLVLDWERIRPFFMQHISRKHRTTVLIILEKMDRAVGGFIRGQLTVSCIVGSLFALGLFGIGLFGFPGLRHYSLLIGTAAAIGGFIPYLGAIIGVTPALLIVLLSTETDWHGKLLGLSAVVLLFSAIQAVEGFILQPKIVGKGAGLHPLAVVLALLAGAQFGIVGMILAIPIACIVRVLYHECWMNRRREMESEEDGGI
ncbi:MAG: AI-2E family transporter [Thermodesulfobacteriota bacterium]